MKRPEFVTDEDITRWSETLDQDELGSVFAKDPIMKEVCYAGFWLSEELDKLDCPEDLSFRIQDAAGRLSFGRDTWEVCQKVLEAYKNNELIFEPEPVELN